MTLFQQFFPLWRLKWNHITLKYWVCESHLRLSFRQKPSLKSPWQLTSFYYQVQKWPHPTNKCLDYDKASSAWLFAAFALQKCEFLWFQHSYQANILNSSHWRVLLKEGSQAYAWDSQSIVYPQPYCRECYSQQSYWIGLAPDWQLRLPA